MNHHSMTQYLQLGDYKPTKKESYTEISITPQSQPQKTDLFIHKLNFPTIVVRAPHAIKKIHCWRLKKLQIVQYSDNFGTCQKVIAEIQFDGELIFTLLQMFNQIMGKEILEYVQNISVQLRKWCTMPIKNIFLVSEKAQQSLGYKHAFLKITPILFHTQRYFYYEYRRWLSKKEQQQSQSQSQSQIQINQIQKAQQIQGSSSYGDIFQNVCSLIKQDRVVRQQMALKRKRRQQGKILKEDSNGGQGQGQRQGQGSVYGSNRSNSGHNQGNNNNKQGKGYNKYQSKSFSADFQQSYQMGQSFGNSKN